jgi:hypothetical protein
MSEMLRKLRAWSSTQDGHVAAAVELLIRHGYWPNKASFQRACIRTGHETAQIDWAAAHHHLAGDPHASPTERAILAYATALATDRYGFSRADRATCRLLLSATTQSLGTRRIRRPEAVRRQGATDA